MKRKAFTIAEAVIILAIIGIVGALSLPTFTNSSSKKMYGTSLAAAINNLETAMTVMISKEGVDDIFQTKTWKGLNNTTISSSANNALLYNFSGNLGEYIPLTFNENTKKASSFYTGNVTGITENKITLNSHSDFKNLVPYKSKNGIVYFIYINDFDNTSAITEADAYKEGIKLRKIAATVFIDVNGNKRPNRIGRDIHAFALGSDGYLYPRGGVDYAYAVHGNKYTWKDTASQYACTSNVKKDDGTGCTARLIENKFNMVY